MLDPIALKQQYGSTTLETIIAMAILGISAASHIRLMQTDLHISRKLELELNQSKIHQQQLDRCHKILLPQATELVAICNSSAKEGSRSYLLQIQQELK